MMNEPISSIMIKDLVTLHPDDTLDKVRHILLSKNIHHLPVTDKENYLVGILTIYDMFKLNMKFEDYSKMTVGEVMTQKVAKLPSWEKVGVCAELFLLNRFHSVPIVDDKNKLVGLVTSFDILRYNFKKAYPTQEI